MASKLSQLMTNFLASPRAMSPIGESEGVKRVKIARISTVAADAAGDLFRLAIMKATDRIISIKWVAKTGDANFTTVDIGIFVPNSASAVGTAPTVVDADGLVVDANLSAETVIPAEILGTGNAAGTADFGKALWEYCPGGPATQPVVGLEYEIIATPGGAVAGGGDYTFIIEYIDGA